MNNLKQTMMKRFLFLACLLCVAAVAFAYTERNLLTCQADAGRLKELLATDRRWVPFPDYADRAGWDSLMGPYREEYIRRGEQLLDYEWRVVRATDYLAYERTGNRDVMEEPLEANNRALASLLLAELAEGKGRFVDQLADGVFHACEMTSWALAAHLVVQPSRRALPAYDYPVIDLVSADMGGVLSWTYYFMHGAFDRIDPEISRRLRHEIEARVMQPYLTNDSFWWMGRHYKGTMLNNWTPWCNSNVLMCFLLMEDNPDTLAHAVRLTMESVDRYLGYIHADGACEEGPSYWDHAAGKLLDYLDLLDWATQGQVSLWREPMVRRMGEYIVRSYVGDGWVVNFADASARCDANPWLAYRFGQAVGSDELKGLAALLHKPGAAPSNGRDLFRTLTALLVDSGLRRMPPHHEPQPFTWYPETQFCYLTTPEGLFVATKGGHNAESHNHNDVGSFSVWIDRTPVLIDAGISTYTRETFGAGRYRIWAMQSGYHNLPMPGGVAQRNGRRYRARDVSARPGRFSLDIAPAYPADAHVERWQRTLDVKGRRVRLAEAFRLAEASAPNVVNFMTWGSVDTASPGRVVIKVGDVTAELDYDARQFDLVVEPKELADPRLSQVWGKSIFRLSFRAKTPAMRGKYVFTLRKR